MPLFACNHAERRYQRRVSIAMSSYVVLLVAEIKLFAHPGLTDPIRFALTLLPGLAVSMVFVALGRYLVEEEDEYLRVRMVRKIVWATGTALVACTLWGFPEDAGFLPHVPLYFAAIVWLAALGIVSCLFKVLGR
ncbi:MAG: hypothetical protein JF628_11180 [Sphingomonas sp.]|nr:hypothetical protein [Sphingomonas sp.]